ncbi:MAG: hypothetical protein QG635_204, partial [Bacteroidota bacterium]|nr:hypothetical protein [Bacteroidota bacterium]
PFFDKKAKRLSKKYKSLRNELNNLYDDLKSNPTLGIPLGKNCYKIRLSIESKGKGKSGGARIITYVYYTREVVYLLTIFDKSDMEDISSIDLERLIGELEE